MTNLNLKPNHKAVKDYYDALNDLATLGASHEGAVSPAFAALLRHCAHTKNSCRLSDGPTPLQHRVQDLSPGLLLRRQCQSFHELTFCLTR